MKPYLPVALPMLAGLVLFLFALSFVSDGLRAVSGERLQDWLSRFTRNVLTGILTGVVITTLLDSSSAVIIMTIALVNANALCSRQALGVVLGANIGTTFSSQLIALDIGQWAGLPMAVGFGLMVIFKQEQIVQWGHVLFGLGLLFLGLFLMEEATKPVKTIPQANMKDLANPAPVQHIGFEDSRPAGAVVFTTFKGVVFKLHGLAG